MRGKGTASRMQNYCEKNLFNRNLIKPFAQSSSLQKLHWIIWISQMKPGRKPYTNTEYEIFYKATGFGLSWKSTIKKEKGGIKRDCIDITIKFRGWFLATLLGENRYKDTFEIDEEIDRIINDIRKLFSTLFSTITFLWLCNKTVLSI